MKLGRQYSIVLVGVIILVALNLRPALTSVGPITQFIQESTGLSTPGMGYLASVPVLCMGIGALVTPQIIRRIGLDLTVVVGLVALTVVILVRSFVPEIGLWIGTVGIGLGIGILNTTLPPIIKRDFPTRSATITGIYSATLTLSSAVAAGIVVPITGATSWKIGLGCWSIVAAVGLCAWLFSMRTRSRAGQATGIGAAGAGAGAGVGVADGAGVGAGVGAADGQSAGATAGESGAGQVPPPHSTSDQPRSQRNILTNPLAWAVTAFMGTQSLLFYMFVQWLPEIEQTHGITAEVAGVHMSFFQAAGLVATLALTALQGERLDQRLGVIAANLLWIIGLAGFFFAPGIALLWAISMGAGSGATFALSLTFINTRTENSHDSSRLSGMSQSVGYMIACVGPTLGGSLGDAFGWNTVIIVAIVLSAVVMAIGMVAGNDKKI